MIITKKRVKSELGILGNQYDAEITGCIPQAESKYRTIANYNFNYQISCSYTSGNTYFNLSTQPDSPIHNLKFGDLIEGAAFPAETYITNINKSTGNVTVSETLTDSGTLLAVCQNIEYWPVISSLVLYMIGRKSVTAQEKKELASKSIAPLSFTFAPQEINKSYGIPMTIVSAIPSYAGIS